MADLIKTYIDELDRDVRSGKATEHSHRPALKRLLESMLDGVQAINEPKHIDCGAPDFIVTRKDIPVGYIEAKDIGKDLNHKDFKGQFDRYKQSLDNLIITDYLDFRRYMKGELADSVRVAEAKGGKITPIKANLGRFEEFIKDFGLARPHGITSPAEIARMMAGKAHLMAEIIEKALGSGDSGNALLEQMNAFKEVLIHDIKPKEFADVYAQTIAYGLFAARLHDESPDTFNRQKAASLIPKTNPFLRQLFQNIAGFDLADTFRAANMAEFKKNFGGRSAQNDPMIHFYEDFLSAYDPVQRKNRGVWYTPQAVVNFIVRAVDEILQKEFNLPTGLADTSKTKIKINGRETDVHKVQILDPATGTGTFLAETITRIYERFRKQSGMWPKYVKEHLIPRLNGFEVLMASYTMAHIKLEQLLSQTGYTATDNQRLRVYLTNSLEEQHPETGSLFAQFLAREANEANSIKRDTPIMVVLGNPPYSVSSQNKGEWIQKLIADYKKNLNEKKINLDDDYIKFIRYGQYYIEKNGEGILAYISNNSFIDGVTHRQMRKTLLDVFDKIYILDLHGSSMKKEVCPNGSKDENVFDIMQGVSINIFVKTGQKVKDALAEIFHFDLYGVREVKYDFLLNNNLQTVKWQPLKIYDESYFFVPKNFGFKDEYEKGFRIDELFHTHNSGLKTDRDSLFIDDDKKALADRIKILLSGKFDDQFRQKFNVEDSSSYKLTEAIKGILFDDSFIQGIEYRPFDKKWIYYTPELISRPADKVMKHFVNSENIGLIVSKKNRQISTGYVFITQKLTDIHVLDNALDSIFVCPLYLCPDPTTALPGEPRRPNLNSGIVSEISKRTGLQFVDEVNCAPVTEAESEDIERVNKIFNDELQKQIDGALPAGHVYRLGRPDAILLSAGVEDLPIELESRLLLRKSSVSYSKNHPFDISDIMDLPKAMNNPIAVFNDSSEVIGGKRILTELQHNGHNFLVAMRVYTDKKNRKINVRVNSIRTVFPKDKVGDVFDWFFAKNDLLRWVDKEKALNFVSIHSTLSNVDGNDIRAQKVVAKINSFQNPVVCLAPKPHFVPNKLSSINKIIDPPEKVNKKIKNLQKVFAPTDLLDYIYAVLHSPVYREKYKEFLKIDFPRIPYPESADRFRAFSALGGRLRRLHLLEGVEPQEGTADYPVPGNDEVEKVLYDKANNKVFINNKQYFDHIPREAWEFYIGGYQPAQKWLKDRKGRILSYDETLHYRRIITVLLKTIEIMEEIKAM